MNRPDGLVLVSPMLEMSGAVSPSRLLGLLDPILPFGMLANSVRAFVSDACDALPPSPLSMGAPLLAALPPTSLLVGSLDPVLDDAVELARRLDEAGAPPAPPLAVHVCAHAPSGTPVRLEVQPEIPHGFLMMAGAYTAAQNGESRYLTCVLDVLDEVLEPNF